MTARLQNQGPWDWGLSIDEEGHRTYFIEFLVEVSSMRDGPALVSLTPGLPVVGSVWIVGNDFDVWAWCYPTMKVSRHQTPKGESGVWWKVRKTFSTKPLFRCQDESVEDPLLEPDRISGGFVKYTQEVSKDRNGTEITSSSHEPIRGPQVEFDNNRPTVRISQNVSSLGLDVFTPMIDTVNDRPLWGLAARKIKLSNVPWERKTWGTCNFYYTRTLEFDIDFTTFDRDIPDVGKKVLRGEWNQAVTPPVWVPEGGTSQSNPTHFQIFKDAKDENIGPTLLDGAGNPSTSETPTFATLEFYGESNFLTLGVPTTL